MKMEIIVRGRGKGKTTELIEFANQEDGVIVCSSKTAAKLTKETAKEMGLCIRDPICYIDLRGVVNRNTLLLFDNAERIFCSMLGEVYGVLPGQILAMSVTADEDDVSDLQESEDEDDDYEDLIVDTEVDVDSTPNTVINIGEVHIYNGYGGGCGCNE